MDRRGALASLAGFWLAGCGGGGGGGGDVGGAMAAAPAPAQVPPPAPVAVAAPAAASGTASISSMAPPPLVPPFTGALALWGDSMIPPVSRALPPLLGGRDVHDGGYPGETSQMVLGHQSDDTQYRGATTLFWTGHNNIRIDSASAASQIKADIAAGVALLAPGNDRYLILSLVNNASEGAKGSAQYDVVTQLNRDLAAQYGYHFVDLRSFMVAQSSANDAQGAANLQADVPSFTLRFDDIHLTGFGADVVARFLKSILDARGW